MRIAYLINQYPQPTQSFIRREILALEKHGVEVARFTLRRWEGDLVDPADQQERDRTRAVLEVGAIGLMRACAAALLSRPMGFCRALRLAMAVGRKSDRGLLVHLIYLAEACVLVKWLRECGAQHVHAHFGTNSATVAMLCRALGGPPFSFTVHGPEEFDLAPLIGLAQKIRRSAFVVGVCEFGRSQLYRWADLADWPKIQVVRCGVDEEFLKAPVVPIPSAPHLVAVGRLGSTKGFPILIEAAARLAGDGVDFKLNLVGDGPLRGHLEQLVHKHGLEKRVTITGWMSGQKVREQIQQSRALVLGSFAEGLPVAIMEALALHRPVISTYVAGVPELVEAGVSGWLVPAGAVEALAEAMRQAIVASPAQLEAMGGAGAARVAEQHDAAREAGKIMALIGANQADGPRLRSPTDGSR